MQLHSNFFTFFLLFWGAEFPSQESNISISHIPIDDTNPPKVIDEESCLHDSGFSCGGSTSLGADHEVLDEESDAPATELDSASREVRRHSEGAKDNRCTNVRKPAMRCYSVRDPIHIKPGGF